VNYDIEPDGGSPLVRFGGTALGIAGGVIGGLIATVLLFAVAATLRAAYPPWDHGLPAIVEVVAMTLCTATVLLAPARNAHATGSARSSSYAAFATLLLFVGGEFLDVIHLNGAHVPFYIVPVGKEPNSSNPHR